ncbi:MAG: hypothetical protein II547_09735, partial [Treponema sp.]|nr:hypothetical protein [Treponema sp.]
IYKQNVREDGYMEGLSDGQKQKTLESAENLFREEIPLEIISRCIGLPLEQVKQIAQSLSVKA